MTSQFKISLQIPNYKNEEGFFSFRLHSVPQIEPDIYSAQEQIFVVSDIEGNFVQLFKLLVSAGIMSRNMDWTFNKGHLVILGDCFDRGEQVTECLWLIYGLEEKAKRHGGYVHFILGNHEIMNMNGDWRYIHPRYAIKTYSELHTPTALYHGNEELWRWLKTKNVVERIGKFLFVHGGISNEVLETGLSIREINEICRISYGKRDEEMNNDQFTLTLFHANTSPFWYRGYYDGTADKKLIRKTLKQFDSYVIITGHTMLENITPYFDNKVFNVNTDHANNKTEGLMMMKNKFYRVSLTGKYEKII